MTPEDPTTPPDEVDAGLAFVYGEDADQDSSPRVLERIAERTGSTARVSLREAGPDPTPMLRPLREGDPRRAGRYVVQGELGRGGVGAVHRGHDQELGRDVALKFVLDKYKDEPEILQRFIEEAQIGGQLQHPGIVPVYDLGMAKGRPFFAMKLVKGETLAKKLAARESVADDRRAFLSIFEDVCQTMAYAHARGVVHRDLKPANVMIGSFGEVQVVDWGLGKVLKQGGVADEALSERDAPAATVVETVRSSGDGSRSVVGSVMGTPAYMPPEQACGEVEAMDERSDVFALGAILCEILTGRPPYVGSRDELLVMAATAHLAGARERLASCGADPELIELTERCLAPAPAARPQSAQVVADAIHGHLAVAEERVHEARVEAAEARVRAAALKRTQRLGLGLTAAIALGLMASLVLWRRADDARALANENADRAERELARANEVKSLIRDMLGSVMPQEALFADTTLMEGILDDAAARLERGEVADELVAAELHDLVGNAYRSLSRFDAAARHLPKALEVTERLLGERDDRTIVVMWHLARLYVELGRAREAEELLRRAVDLHDCPRGELCPTYMSALGTLGGAYVALDRKAEADEIFRQALARNTAAFGPYHPETLDSRGMLAMNLMNLGHLDEAARSTRETVAALEEIRARDHPHTVDWKVHLVAILEDQGHWEEALDIALECVEIGERCWGPENTRTLRAKKKLADVSSSLGRGEEAERLYLELVESYRRLLGEEHRDTLALRSNLARNYAQMGRLDTALEICRDALPTAARALGDDDTLTVLIQRNLATYAHNVGALAEAEAHGRAVLEKRTRRSGAEAPETLEAMGELAKTLQKAQRSDDAEALLRDVLAIRRRRGIPDDPDALQLRKDLAWSVLVQGRFDDAGELYDDLMARVERELAPDDPLRLALQTDVAASYCLQGRQVEGCVLLEQTLEQMVLTLGPEDRRTLITAGNLAHAYFELEQYDDAVSSLEPYLDACRRRLDPPTLRRSLGTVAYSHLALGDHDTANACFAELLESELEPAGRPGAAPGERNAAAWRLLTHEREELRDPGRALGLAELACAGEEARAGEGLWMYLDTLSLALERTGDAAGALETQRRAVSLIPEDADLGTAADVRRRLAELEAADR